MYHRSTMTRSSRTRTIRAIIVIATSA